MEDSCLGDVEVLVVEEPCLEPLPAELILPGGRFSIGRDEGVCNRGGGEFGGEDLLQKM